MFYGTDLITTTCKYVFVYSILFYCKYISWQHGIWTISGGLKAIVTFLIIIIIVMAGSLVDHLGNKFSSSQLDDAQAFYCSISKPPNLLNSWMKWSLNGTTDTEEHTLQAFIGSIDARSLTLLSRPAVISNPDRGARGPLSNQRLLASAVTALWVESQIIASPIRLDSDTKGRELWWRFHLSFSLSAPPVCSSSPLLLLLLLQSSIFSPPFCVCRSDWRHF